MHEHVFIMTTEITQNYPEDWGDEARREADAIDRLNELKARGVDSIVDLTVVGLGSTAVDAGCGERMVRSSAAPFPAVRAGSGPR